MHASEVISVAIERPYSEVYEYLANPMNFPSWAGNPDSGIVALGHGTYMVDLPMGRRAIRFTPHNEYGVLDYEVFDNGKSIGPVVPVRLTRNGDGCDLALTWLQRPGVSIEQFHSDAEWARSDLTRLKTLLEGG